LTTKSITKNSVACHKAIQVAAKVVAQGKFSGEIL